MLSQALINDGWHITHDPYSIIFIDRRAYVDLGAERIAAERDGQQIAVEIKSFIGPSSLADVEQALGQYLLYRSWMLRTDPTRQLYLAVDEGIARTVFAEPAIMVLVQDYQLQLLVIDVANEEVVEWRN